MGINITIKDALNFLDPNDDSDWTEDGMPRMDVLEKILDNKAITREDVLKADPEFCRDTAWKRKVNKPEENDGVRDEKEKEEKQTEMSLDKQISELMAERDQISKRINVLEKQRDRLQAEKDKEHSPKADTIARLEYIKRQNEIRARRAATSQKVIQMIGKDNITAKSPLDQAMSRKTARGSNRPQINLQNQNSDTAQEG